MPRPRPTPRSRSSSDRPAAGRGEPARPNGASPPTSEKSPDAVRSLADLPEAAGRILPAKIRAYVDGGAGGESTLRANREAFARRTLRPKALAAITGVDLRTTVLGREVAAPVFLAPMAYQAEVHPDGEPATAKAAAAAGLLAVFSTLSSVALEAISDAAPGAPRWFQLYLQEDPEVTARLVGRARQAGYGAIVLTVDVPILGVRDLQGRHGFALDDLPEVGNGPDVHTPERAREFAAGGFRLRADATHGWDVVDTVRSASGLPVVVKGILSASDARLAVDHGAAGVVVSNHGGRQLDGAPASLDVLPEVVAEVGGDAEVFLDGGVRRGPDVVKALALGARAVGIGRPVLWALALGGEPMLRRTLAMLTEEVAVTMALMGRAAVGDLDRSAVSGT